MTAPAPLTPQALTERYPVWFCDIWGVVHNGVAHFPTAAAALASHRVRGGIVVLVTNAPRRRGPVAVQLEGLGVTPASYDRIVTSGDVTRALIAAHAGKSIVFIGPDRDLTLLDGLSVRLTRDVTKASAVLCTGLFDDLTETPEMYATRLAQMADLGLPFICANPDRTVRHGNTLIYCAGALADIYASLGGAVHMAGKPYAPIYDLALQEAAQVRGQVLERKQVLCIGDGPETDILGAAENGFDVLLIAGGINDALASLVSIEAEIQARVPRAQIVATLRMLDDSAMPGSPARP